MKNSASFKKLLHNNGYIATHRYLKNEGVKCTSKYSFLLRGAES